VEFLTLQGLQCIDYVEYPKRQIFPILLSLYILMYLNFCPLLGFYAAPFFTLLKTFRENISSPSLRAKQPKNKVVELLGVS